jgi:hypothetical protein
VDFGRIIYQNRMKYLLQIGLFFILLVGAGAQPAIQWQRTYGGSDIDEALSVDSVPKSVSVK